MNLAAALEYPSSSIVLGIVTGLGYGLLSAGLVIVYRSNRVVNFAHGEIGALAAALFSLIVTRVHVPYYIALPLGLAAGGAIAALAEVIAIRRLRSAPRLMTLVATLGLAQLLVPLTLAVNGATRQGLYFPQPPGLPKFEVGGFLIHPAASGLLFFSPVAIVGLAVFLRRSRFGLALRGASANPEAARMAGVFASRMSTLAWAIGGALSTFTAILVAPITPGGLFGGAAIGPSLLMRGLAGAVIGRMTNIPVALFSGVVIGVVEGFFFRNFRSGGQTEAVLFVIILAALLFQARERTREEEKGAVWTAVQAWRPLPEELAKLWPVRNLGAILGVVALAFFAIVPMKLSNTTATSLTGLMVFVMVALSVGIITGLGGQLTLGQFALAGVGATASFHLANLLGGNPISLLIGGLAAAAATIIIGLPALRIKGLFLAVTTLSFAVMTSIFLLKQPFMLGSGASPTPLIVAGVSLDGGRRYYYLALAVFVLLFLIARNIRRTGFGRLLLATRDNEDAARAFGISTRTVKVQAFLLGGFIAGVGGAAYGHSIASFGSGNFNATASIDLVITTVIGGIGILAGPLLGVLLVKGLPSFVTLESVGLFAQRAGLLLLILYFPGGLVQLMAPIRDRVIRGLGRLMGVDAPSAEQLVDKEEDLAILARPKATLKSSKRDGRVVTAQPSAREILRTVGVKKTYGGLTAVDDVSLTVREGETLGLIGPNGAGKTTLFEMLAGFVAPDQGRIWFQEKDITRTSPESRVEAGLVRSFQDVQLFPTLTVLDTVQISLERRLRTSFFLSVVGMTGVDKHREKMARDLVGGMGLWSYRNKQIQELSTGTRRIVELACMVALQPTLLLLDEPSSGIAQRETEALGQLLLDLKAQHGMTLLVIEHDIPLIMAISNRVIAMDAGRVIAEGSPEIVREDPVVVEAYLGGRIEAIERSGVLSRREDGDDGALAAIPGLGPARRAALLAAFGSVDAIRKATVEEISNVRGVGSSLARKISKSLG
jgi:ABC-type branched-subunit amino acid transport system ATPase component/ABC-type branched-subunit amino acid transport system permease subunit